MHLCICHRIRNPVQSSFACHSANVNCKWLASTSYQVTCLATCQLPCGSEPVLNIMSEALITSKNCSGAHHCLPCLQWMSPKMHQLMTQQMMKMMRILTAAEPQPGPDLPLDPLPDLPQSSATELRRYIQRCSSLHFAIKVCKHCHACNSNSSSRCA